jgi:hypothetical protein
MFHRIKQDESKRCPFTYEAGRGIAVSVLNLGAKKEWVVNATPRPALPRGKTPGTPRAGGWVYPIAGLDAPGNSVPPPLRNSNPGPSIP